MSFNIIATFRDNENYLVNFLLPILTIMEKSYEFYYYFYENDSKDNSRKVLKNFMEERNGEFKYEDINSKTHPRNLDKDRINNIVNARNNYLNHRPFKGKWSIMVDSDVIFSPDIIEQFFRIELPHDLVALGCNGKDSNRCRHHKDCNHYYDSLALLDKNDNLGLDYLCTNGFQCCMLKSEEDRDKWFKGELVKVNSGYGGVCFYKTDVLNRDDVYYELPSPINTLCPEKEVICEHWSISEKIRRYGNIYLCPTIIVKNTEG